MEDNPQEWPKEIIYKDVPALEYENGTVLNADTKKIMKPADHALFQVGGENDPVEALKTRYEMAVNAAMEALASGENAEDVASGAYGGWKAVVEAQKRLSLDTSKGHASTRAAEFIGKATGFLGDRMQQDGRVRMQDASGNSLDAPSMSAAMQLIEKLRNK